MKKRLKGFFCSNCAAHRLHVVTVVRAAPLLITRYRECVICNERMKTEERVEGDLSRRLKRIQKLIPSKRRKPVQFSAERWAKLVELVHGC